MSVRRVMGTEVEYGISVAGPARRPTRWWPRPRSSTPTPRSTVKARRARWDFEEESPLRDARGFDMARQVADPSQLTDEDLGLANVILTNGARLYVDHAHPEYSSPEVTTPLDVVRVGEGGGAGHARRLADGRAGARQRADPALQEQHRQQGRVLRRPRELPDAALDAVRRDRAPPDAVLRLAARSSPAPAGSASARTAATTERGFQISQRADYFEVEVGLETTLKRPIINTRDEPHADPEVYRRLHVILGDANLAEVSIYLKVGTTALVLAMIEDGFIDRDLSVEGPVAALRDVSHDPTLRHLVTLRDGRRLTARPAAAGVPRPGPQVRRGPLRRRRRRPDRRRARALGVGARPASSATRWSAPRELDWVAKLKLLEQYRDRDGLDWDDAKLHLIDLQYADVRPEKGLYHRLAAAGRIERLLDDATIEAAMHDPPTDTRAYFRGRCLEKYADAVAAASWDSVIFDLPGRESLQRVPTIDPLRGTRAHVGDLIDRCDTAEQLVAALTR